ncbi:MAG: 2,3-bisphosphoglycerate-independent phosphoglycerate mutase [Planctomycetota bacterium]
MPRKTPTLLIVLDGWGHGNRNGANAIVRAPADHFLSLWDGWPHTLLSASGREVGLPLGLMGNSEVGHTNLGSGRTVFQEISRIDLALESGEFQRNAVLRRGIDHALETGGVHHLIGLVGSGDVHASDRHSRALADLARSMRLPSGQLCFHALLDGRDTPPDSSPGFLRGIEDHLEKAGIGRIATVSGRYYGMDRDKRWERTKLYWDCIVHGRGERAPSALEAVEQAFREGRTDEFVKPTVVGDPERARIRSGDSVFIFNFRADRVRQISQAFLFDEFEPFERGARPEVHFATMTQYRKDFPCPVAFPPREIRSLFGELVSARGLSQLRCAETEKYAHVTFFFNGGREEPYPGEERVLIPSPKVATYDLKPEMSADQVGEAVLERLEKDAHDLYVVNFANADMVGHTGILSAAEAAVRAVDRNLARVVEMALSKGGAVAVTADHGNAEMMVDPQTGGPHTAHTTNPVPFLLIGERFRGARLREMGVLADVAPTLMGGMGIEVPEVMDGKSLLLS